MLKEWICTIKVSITFCIDTKRPIRKTKVNGIILWRKIINEIGDKENEKKKRGVKGEKKKWDSQKWVCNNEIWKGFKSRWKNMSIWFEIKKTEGGRRKGEI